MLKAVSRWLVAIIVFILLVVVTWLVYEFRGIAASYTHLYYIPIILAGIFLGDIRAAIVGLLAAGLSGGVTYVTRGPAPVSSEIVIRSIIFFAVAVLTARLSAILREKGEEASSLFSVAHAVSQSLRLDDILPVIAKMSAQITEGQASIIRLLARRGDELRPAASWGLSSDYIAKGPVRIGDSTIDQEVKRGNVIILPDMRRDLRTYRYREEAAAEGLVACICVPLQRGERFLGVLRVYSNYPRHWSRRDQRLLRALASEAAVAIENAQLHETIRRSYWETVRALTRAIEAKDPHMLGHSERVTGHVLQIARQMGLSADEMEILRFAATLHDIGKIAVEEQLLRSSNPQAYRDALEKNHPLVGMSILQPAEFLRPALDGVRYHHEHFDGSGYPEGLKGENIPLQARLVAVANYYDSLTHPPSGSEPLAPQTAILELQRLAGTIFDPRVVDALAATLGERVGKQAPVESSNTEISED